MRKREYTNRFVCADAIEFMKQMPESSVDLIFTSPPDLTETAFNAPDTIPRLGDYLDFQREFVEQFCRVTKQDGFVVISQTDRKLNGFVHSHFARYISHLFPSCGFKLKDQKIIVKKPPVGAINLYRFTFQHMGIWTVNGSFPRKGDFLRDIIVDNEHTFQHKGIQTWTQTLCRLVVESLTKPGALVFDPFAATGPVLFAAQQTGRDYLGCELNKEIHAEGKQFFKKGEYPQ